ncbi:MAG: glycosyltransferase [Candidatus Omnitrophica bacterium]|nr:glycosyltransferase [Candidatus Omnitrophota bacterium]
MVSILIVAWNAAKFLKPCIDAALAQQGIEREIIVVDNASTDETPRILAGYRPRITVLTNKKNEGFCRGNNQALQQARGRYIVTLNSDALLDPAYTATVRSFLETHPRAGMAQGKMLRLDNGRIDCCGLVLSAARRFYNRGEGSPAAARRLNRPCRIFGPCAAAAMYRRELVEDLRQSGEFFDEAMFFLGEDFDVAWRARRCGWQAWYVPAAVCRHYRQSAAHQAEYKQYLSFRNRYILLLKNESWFGFLRLIPFFAVYDLPRFLWMCRRNSRTVEAVREIRRMLPDVRMQRRLIRAAAQARRSGAAPLAPPEPESAHIRIVITSSAAGWQRCAALFESLAAQTRPPDSVAVVFDGPRPPALPLPPRAAAFVCFERQGAQTLTAVQNQALGAARADYLMMLNDDVVLDAGFVAALAGALAADPQAGMAVGKLLRPGRRCFDTTGQFLLPARNVVERGYALADHGQYEYPTRVFGGCGAAVMYRRKMLEAVALAPGEYFDASYHLFYEDVDLSWRAWNAGWKALYVPQATATHVRGATAKQHRPAVRRFERFEFAWLPAALKARCLLNRYATIIKNDSAAAVLPSIGARLLYETKLLLYCLCFDPRVLFITARSFPAVARRAWRMRKNLRSRFRRQRR